ncbi:DUF3797 domain-containing protein [Proteiniclasticum sp. BAD-10]|uniref:DUF3797 domain-containing protein n=1 Tax=Proteiniclasticum sediminis TaxID=2804028 RepID=A0A941CQD0_9CLOT|nr:DUF3797 domain-containing protein [Proteiniclasticum sediminis]MBR0575704.1 DUF3797 domain-containing protein [Proteiniclasticum sediminis]
MNIRISQALMKAYEECPKCRNPYLGNGQGTLLVDDWEFKRTCKCGFEVSVKITEQMRGKK